MFKRAKTILLSTDDKTNIEKFKDDTIHYISSQLNNHLFWKYQHLYFITDDEIKENDWYINSINTLSKAKLSNLEVSRKNCFKIIASTDKSLNLPKPSQSFIKKYCEKGGIDEVLIELNTCKICNYPTLLNGCDDECIPQIKVDKNNEITIKAIKDSFSKDDLENAYFHGCKHTVEKNPDFNKWFNNNF